MKPLESLVRPNIWALEPYSTARDDFQGTGVDVWLDANESPYDSGFNRYPDPHQRRLKHRIAQIKGVRETNIFIGNGSDEAIDIAYRVFCTPGVDNAVAIAPSYGMYQVAADINNVEMRQVLLNDDFSLPTERLLGACDSRTKLIWICSPNNPTANAFPPDRIKEVLDAFDGIVVVDEAYIDFSDKGSMLQALDSHPNLIVLQTMSKARGMAALRVGLAFASEQIAALMAKVKYPYNIGTLTQRTVEQALETDITPQVEETITERRRLAGQLAACKCVERVYPSDANFLLVKVTDPDALYDRLIDDGVIVRNRSRMPLCSGCLRITIGTPEENRRTLQTIRNFSL